MATDFTPETFKSKVIQGKGVAVVDFWAPWCGPCKMMAPVFNELAEHNDDLTFGKVNVDEHGDIAGQFDVQSIPTIIFFKDGKEVHRAMGFMSKEQLNEELEKVL